MQKQLTKQMTGILAGTLLLVAVVAITMPKAEAMPGTVYMKIYNSKTGTEKVVEWQSSNYRYEKKAVVDTNDVMVKKISKIFNTTELTVRNTITSKPQTANWQHFVVTIGSDAYKAVKFL